ncbi:MAG TPA: hypothetical protein EYQ74_07495 [Planctomycetes bacterium]|nr:hypothetical protein [Planctomycetota bacterium]HIK60213.1 hypothetical protein [Planctomycetota bacterium]
MPPGPPQQPTQDAPEPLAPPTQGGREACLWLGLACLLGLIRFLDLGSWSLWLDEALTWADAHHGDNYNWPGYALVRWTVELLGQGPSEFSLRLLPALAGWLGIPAAWWALQPWIGGRRAALVALLVALSPWEVYWSQTARFYTMVQLTSLLGTGFVLRGLLRDSIPTACLGLGVAALGAFLQLQAVIVGVALAFGPALAWLLLKKWEPSGEGFGPRGAAQLPARVVGSLVALALLSGLGVLPWALDVFRKYSEVKQDPPLASLLHLVRSTAYYLTPALSVAALIGALVIGRSRDVRGCVLLGIVVCGVGCLALAGTFARASAQYGLSFMPFVCALALWVTSLPPLSSRRGLRLAVVAVLCAPLLAGLALYFTTQHGQRPRWKEAYEYVGSLRAEQDLVLGMQAPVGEFYLVPGATDLRHPELIRWCDRSRPRAWRAAVKTEKTVWVVVRPDFLTEWEPKAREAFEGFLRESCRLQRRFPVRQEGRDLDVEVYRYR